MPSFDVLMLGIGPEGARRVAVPRHACPVRGSGPSVAVHGSPKPPPTRLTLTLPAITAAREVWIIASGEDKAGAIRLALSGAGPVQVPAAGRTGQAADPVPAGPGRRCRGTRRSSAASPRPDAAVASA